jgi:hypothetical protein
LLSVVLLLIHHSHFSPLTMVAKPAEQDQAPMSENHEKHLAGSDGEALSSASDHLSGDERMIIDKQLTAPSEKIGFFALFRYATTKEILIMVVATISSIIAGACLPLMTVSGRKQLKARAQQVYPNRLCSETLPEASRAFP